MGSAMRCAGMMVAGQWGRGKSKVQERPGLEEMAQLLALVWKIPAKRQGVRIGLLQARDNIQGSQMQ